VFFVTDEFGLYVVYFETRFGIFVVRRVGNTVAWSVRKDFNQSSCRTIAVFS